MNSISVETDRYLSTSTQVTGDDIDWGQAKQAGLSEAERYMLSYFSDIESQTIIYMRDILHTEAAFEPDTTAFLAMWNYEEFFHGRVLARVMKECGYPLEGNRTEVVRKKAQFSEKIEAIGASILSRIFRSEFPAVYTAWGAIQELTTLRGYEELGKATQNPALKTLCSRIAKQERRHYAWYYNNAQERLSRCGKSRWLARNLMKRFWSPVGAGVKRPKEVATLFAMIFPGEKVVAFSREIDAKVSSLPGLSGLKLMEPYMKRLYQLHTPLGLTAESVGFC